MNRLKRLHAEQQELCSSILGQQLRRRSHQTESSSVLQEDRIYPLIKVAIPKRMNASPYRGHTEERYNVIVFSPIAQQPSSGIEGRLQTIQKTPSRAVQQTAM